MSGPGELAVQVKGVGLHRTHLHLADVEAFRPAVGHAIHFFRPLTLSGRSTVTCTFSARHLNHVRAAFCLNTPRRIPSLRVVNCCKMSSTGKSSQSILSLPMSVRRFFSSSIAPRWKCNSLLLTASFLWVVSLEVSEAMAGSSNHNLCLPQS